MRRMTIVPAALAAMLAASACFAELPAQKEKAALGLIGQFASVEFAARQQAVDALIAMGPEVAPLVRKTLAETTDNETKLRCEMVLKGLAEKYGIAEADSKAQGFGASLITLDVKEAPLVDVLEMLAEKSGNQLIRSIDANRGGKKGPPLVVTASMKDKPYWEALDEVCRQVDLCCDAGFDAKNKLRLRAPVAKGEEKCCTAGPVSVRLDYVQRSESATSWTNYRASTIGPRKSDRQVTVSLPVRYFVEDRLPILASWLEFAKARTPDGVEHIPPAMKEQFRQNRRAYSSSSVGPWNGQAQLSLSGADANIDKPLTIEGRVSLELAAGRKELRFAALKLGVDPGARSVTGDGIEIRLAGFERQGFAVRATCEINADPGVPVFTGGSEAAYGFSLVDSKGKAYKEVSQFNWTSKTGSTSGGETAAGTRLDPLSPAGKTLDGRLTVSFANVRTVEGDWTLVFAMPERCEVKEFPFVIRDIEVPKGPAADAPE